MRALRVLRRVFSPPPSLSTPQRNSDTLQHLTSLSLVEGSLNASNAEGPHLLLKVYSHLQEQREISLSAAAEIAQEQERSEKAALLGEPVEEQWARAAWHQVFKGERGSKGRRGAAPGPT